MTHRVLGNRFLGSCFAESLALVAVLGLAACGDKIVEPDTMYDFAGQQVDLAGVDTSAKPDLAGLDLTGADLAGADLATNPDAPTITIVTPAVADVLVGNTLKVTVTVVSPVGASITDVSLLAPTQPVPVTLALTAPNTYEGTVNVSGALSLATFTVTATDAAARSSMVEGTYKRDIGPIITILAPTALNLHGQTPIQVSVVDPLSFAIDAVDVKAGIVTAGDIVLTEDAGIVPMRLSGTIVFASFTPPLDGQQRITVTAKNSNGTTSSATRDFTVDNAGPTITINTPLAGEFAAAFVTINATIDDDSGVDESTVSAVFANDAVNFSTKLTRTAPTAKTFQGTFDVRKLGNNFVLPSLSVRADDVVGNHREVAYSVAVDNTPPVLSLDPPGMRVATKPANEWQCSAVFDPVGDESVNDGDTVQQVFTVKARIEDEGNDPPGNTVVRISTVDPATVRLVIIPTPGDAGVLAVDTDGDGMCDNVNPNLVPISGMIAGSNQSIQYTMQPLIDTGIPNYFTSGAPVAGCDVIGNPALTAPPQLLCSAAGTSLTYGLRYSSANLAAIWAPEPVKSTSTGCIGAQIDSLNSLPEGGLCAVVVATDKTKNTSVSAPIRLCVARNTAGVCTSFTGTANCTGTYDPVTKVTTATPCTPRPSFFAGEVRRLLN